MSTPLSEGLTLHCALLPDERGYVATTGAATNRSLPGRAMDVNWDTPLEVVRTALSEEMGFRVNLLRSVFHRKPSAGRPGLRIWLTEPAVSSATPARRLAWVDPGCADMPCEETRTAIQCWHAEVVSGEDPPFRQAWSRPGWHAQVVEWVELELRKVGTDAVGPVEQLRSWAISNLMRLPTDQGWVYFKAVPPYFACEPAATLALSLRYPGIIPEVLAADGGRGWLLLRGFESKPLGQVEDIEQWSDVFRLLARMQHDYAGRSEEIRSWSSLIRPVDRLPAAARWLLDEALPEVSSHVDDWPAGLMEKMRDLLPLLEEYSALLASAGAPETLIHGDWHANNVHAGPAGPIFLDWSDAAYTHPFFDLFTMFDFHDLRDKPVERLRLLAVYLDAWRESAPDADVEEAARLAYALAPLYHAVSYARIVLNVEPADRPMFAGDVRRFIELYVERMKQLREGTDGWSAAS